MVEAITEMASDQQSSQRYLGSFLAIFCPKVSEVVKPLRDLAHKDVPFKWTDAHDKAFENLIAHAPVLWYFILNCLSPFR